MNSANRADLDPEDYFSETRMSFGDHIEELRTHLLRAIYGFLIMLVGSFFISPKVLDWIGEPVAQQLEEFYQRRVKKVEERLRRDDPEMLLLNKPQKIVLNFSRQDLLDRWKITVPDNSPGLTDDGKSIAMTAEIRPLELVLLTAAAERIVGRRPSLATLRIEEGFMVYFKVSMLTAFVLGSPWIFYQIWAFIAAGLYPHEKRYVNIYLPFSILLFIGGVLVCQFLVLPKAIEALLWFNEWLGMEPELRLNDWLGFALMMPVVFGLSFQTPLVMLFLERMGIVPVEVFARSRRIAWFLMALFAAIITPSVDAFSMLFLWVPLVLLYELGIVMCRLSPGSRRSPFDDLDVPDSEEMIEV